MALYIVQHTQHIYLYIILRYYRLIATPVTDIAPFCLDIRASLYLFIFIIYVVDCDCSWDGSHFGGTVLYWLFAHFSVYYVVWSDDFVCRRHCRAAFLLPFFAEDPFRTKIAIRGRREQQKENNGKNINRAASEQHQQQPYNIDG